MTTGQAVALLEILIVSTAGQAGSELCRAAWFEYPEEAREQAWSKGLDLCEGFEILARGPCVQRLQIREVSEHLARIHLRVPQGWN